MSHAYLGSLLKMRILEVAPLVLVPPYYAKPIFVFQFDLGLTGASFLDLFLLLIQHFEVNHQQQKLATSCVYHYCRFRTFTCTIWGINSPTLYSKCVLLIKTRQRSSAWALLVEKHQQNQKFIYSSLALGTLNLDRANVMCIIYSDNMGDKIRRMQHFDCDKKSGVA